MILIMSIYIGVIFIALVIYNVIRDKNSCPTDVEIGIALWPIIVPIILFFLAVDLVSYLISTQIKKMRTKRIFNNVKSKDK